MSAAKRIRVLECIRQGQIGGGESHLLSLVENIDRTKFDPVVLSFTDGPMVERLNLLGVKTNIIHTVRPFDVHKWKKVKEWIRSEKIDLIHAHGTRANSNILWAARSLGIPVVYTIHGWSFHDDQNPVVKKIRVLGEKYLTSKSTLNISVSQSNKETGHKYFNGFRSVVVNNGINTNVFNPERTFKDIRQELNIPENATLVLFLARFTHQKQPIVLLKAFIEAAKKDESLFLLMVGDGEQKEEAIQLFETSGFKNRIILSSFRQDVPDILAAADIFVLASLWEGLPIALLEAMSMGKAIIATKVDGTREILRHKENGFLIETDNLQQNLTNSLLELSSNDQLKSELQRNA
ncbi:MAG: glycosyltransferase family 4 protein, partial [Flavisolibacter sp.]|nr:glycosyltransferase family 4 protein [Flavisolibacter sp.]